MSIDRISHVLRSTRRLMTIAALCVLVATGTATWLSSGNATAAPAAKVPAKVAAATPAPDADDDGADEAPRKARGSKKQVTGKLNLNTATQDQLELLPGIGPSKAERVVAWRKKNGGFKRVADLRKVKGFGYKTLKKLEPFLDIKGDTTIAAQ
jgi:competence protein ComEA